jgi:hypothetical protein
MRRPLGLAAMLAAGISLAAPAALASPQGPAGPAGPAGFAGRAITGPGGLGIRLVDAPVSEAADHRAWWYIIDFLHPGTVIHRRVAVQNDSPQAPVVRVYPGAAAITNGEFTGEAGQASNDLTMWTSVSHPVLRLRPWETVMDMVTIRVPRYASQGERYAAIWAQETSRALPDGGLGFAEVYRVGVRVYLDVGPGGPPPTRFAVTSITGGRTPGGSPEVVVGVHDTGARAIDVYGHLVLSHGPGGLSAGQVMFQSGLTLAPGQSGRLVQAFSKAIPAGAWQVTVTLQSDETTVQADATVQLGALRAAAFALPGRGLLGAGALAIALALGLGGWTLRRALRVRQVQPGD